MDATFRCVLLLVIFQYCVCPPVTKKQPAPDLNENEVDHLEQLGIEYNRYLKQVVETLEGDADFRKKLETAQEADIRSGKIAEELDYVNHHVRTKLDELKRQELDRLRNLAKLAIERDNNHESPHLRPPEHLDHANPNSFEIADLHKLIRKVTEDLEEADKKRREEFKQYEMQKEFEQHEKMKGMDDEQKKKYEEELEIMKKKHMKHDPLHHPGSKQQLEEVWEKQDHMAQQEFDPKTFFYLHDLDGNGFWDQDEVKALFLKELDKLYQAGVPEDDMKERAEEMERMREHVFKETDINRDRLISFEEFIQQTRKPDFERDQGWETLDQQQVYTPDEYAEFERRRQEEIQRLIKAGRLPPHPPGMMMPPHPGMAQGQYQQQYMQQPQYGQHPNSVYQQQQFSPQQQQQLNQQQQQFAQQQQIYAQQQAQQQQQQGGAANYQIPQGQVVPNQPLGQPVGQVPQQPVGQPSVGQMQARQVQQQPVGQQIPQQPIGQQIPQQPTGQQIQQPQGQQVPQQPSGQQVPQQPSGQQVPQQPISQQVPQQPISQQVPQQPLRQQIPQQNIGGSQNVNAQLPQQPAVQQPVAQPAQLNVHSNDVNSIPQQQYDPNSIQMPPKQQAQAPNDNAVPPVRFASGVPKQPYPQK